MCKIGFRSVRLYGLGIILSPSISETISTEGVIEFKKTPSLIWSSTLPWLVMAIPPNPGLQRGNLPLENCVTLFQHLLSVISKPCYRVSAEGGFVPSFE